MFAQMRLADLATAWLRDDTHETLVLRLVIWVVFKIMGFRDLGISGLGFRMGGFLNYGPFLGTLNIRCRIIIGTQKGTIILTTTHLGFSAQGLGLSA